MKIFHFILIPVLVSLAACDSTGSRNSGADQFAVASHFPAANQADVFPDSAIEIRFSRELAASLPAVPVAITSSSGAASCSCETDESGTMIVCTPDAKLAENTSYTVSLSPDIVSADGSPLADTDYSYGFTTVNRRTTAVQPVFCSYQSGYLPVGATLEFSTPLDSAGIYTGASPDPDATAPDSWTLSNTLTAGGTGTLKVFARIRDEEGVIGSVFSFTYEVVDAFPGVNSSQEITGAAHVALADTSIAPPSSCAAFTRGLDRTTASAFDDPGGLLAGGSGMLNLGNTGGVTFTFDQPIADGEGADIAIFENGFLTTGGLIAEYGYVEVSSNGTDYIRFDSATTRDPSTVPDPDTTMTGWDTTLDWGVTGRYPAGYGDSFDLAWLRTTRKVVEGRIDLSSITYVRIIDIIGMDEARLMGSDTGSAIPRSDHQSLISSILGNYDSLDSFGSVIFDEYPTVGTGGLDIDAVGVILW
ncbi:MAG TPA: Ig-like domain-containing protein [Spirochaetota bacterium]|nr:Ig-like domain-containing protein [Spirochaetota bacterium]